MPDNDTTTPATRAADEIRAEVTARQIHELGVAADALEREAQMRLDDAARGGGHIVTEAQLDLARRRLAAVNDLRDYQKAIAKGDIPYSHTKLEVLTKIGGLGGEALKATAANRPVQEAAAERLVREGMLTKAVHPDGTVTYQLARCHHGEPGEPIPGRPAVLTAKSGVVPDNPHYDPRVVANPDGTYGVGGVDVVVKDPEVGWGHIDPSFEFKCTGTSANPVTDPAEVLRERLLRAEEVARVRMSMDAPDTPQGQILADPRVTARDNPDTGTPSYSVKTDTGSYLLQDGMSGYTLFEGPGLQMTQIRDETGKIGMATHLADPAQVVGHLLNEDDKLFVVADELRLRADTAAHTDVATPEELNPHSLRADSLETAAETLYTDVRRPTNVLQDDRVTLMSEVDGLAVAALDGHFEVRPAEDGYALYREEYDEKNDEHVKVRLSADDGVGLDLHETVKDLLVADAAVRVADALRQGADALTEDLAILPKELAPTDADLHGLVDDMRSGADQLDSDTDYVLRDMGAGAYAKTVAENNAAARAAQLQPPAAADTGTGTEQAADDDENASGSEQEQEAKDEGKDDSRRGDDTQNYDGYGGRISYLLATATGLAASLGITLEEALASIDDVTHREVSLVLERASYVTVEETGHPAPASYTAAGRTTASAGDQGSAGFDTTDTTDTTVSAAASADFDGDCDVAGDDRIC